MTSPWQSLLSLQLLLTTQASLSLSERLSRAGFIPNAQTSNQAAHHQSRHCVWACAKRIHQSPPETTQRKLIDLHLFIAHDDDTRMITLTTITNPKILKPTASDIVSYYSQRATTVRVKGRRPIGPMSGVYVITVVTAKKNARASLAASSPSAQWAYPDGAMTDDCSGSWSKGVLSLKAADAEGEREEDAAGARGCSSECGWTSSASGTAGGVWGCVTSALHMGH